MTKNEMTNIIKWTPRQFDDLITAKDLKNKSDRTLLYGYDCDRNTWHTYIKNRKIHTIIGSNEVNIDNNFDYIPNKRLYAQCCDYEFCSMLADLNVNMAFTNYGESSQNDNGYYGAIL